MKHHTGNKKPKALSNAIRFFPKGTTMYTQIDEKPPMAIQIILINLLATFRTTLLVVNLSYSWYTKPEKKTE